MSERDDEPTLLGLLVDDRERSSVPSITGPAIPPRPERARRTGRTLVVDAFLVGTTDDPVDHDHAANAVRLEEEDELLEDRRILAHVTLRHEVAPEVRRGIVLLRDHRRDQLRRPPIVRAVEGDGPDREAAKAPFRLLPEPLVQLPCPARRHHRHDTRLADRCPEPTGSGAAVKGVLLRASGVADPSPFLVLLEARILRRRLADPLHHARVGGLRLPPSQPDQPDREEPLVPVVEEEEHLLAHLGKGGAEPGPPDASRASTGLLAQVGEQLVALLGPVVVALEVAVEAEGVVEVEAEGADDGRGEILEGPAARELDVAIEAAAQGSAEDARARIGHARLPAGGCDVARRASARAGPRTRREG